MMLAILLSVHEMGIAGWEVDPKTSIEWNNQVWDAKNVLVTDGLVFDFCSSTESFFDFIWL